MTSTTAFDYSARASVVLVEFRFGDPAAYQFERYTNSDSDVTTGAGTFSSLPAMEIKLPPYGVGSDEKPCEITVKKDILSGLFDAVSKGEPHSRVEITIQELAEGRGVFSPKTELITLFKGILGRAIKSKEAGAESVRMEFLEWRTQLQVSMGLQANAQCVWTFGGRGCQIAVPTFVFAVINITGVLVQVSVDPETVSPTPAPSNPVGPRFWHRGFLERNGLRIMIKDWFDGDVFTLLRKPPEEWAGQSVTASAGCDKSPGTCDSTWANIENFGGFGISMPSYNPLLEQPPSP